MIGGKVRGAILNRVNSEDDNMTKENIEKMLGVNVIGMVPEDANVRRSSAARAPIVVKFPSSNASKAFRKIARDIAGIKECEEDKVLEYRKKEGFVERLARALFPGD